MKKNNLKKGIAMCLASAMITSFTFPTGVEAATWKQNNTGWWWQEDNGSYPTNEWKTVKGAKYHFNGNGYMNYGWYWDGSNWYYLGGKNDGSMKIGWQYVNGQWYFMNNDGRMATGWVAVKGKWYYMSGSGAMLYGWQKIGSNWYYLSGANDGSMKTGWQFINGKWYYMNGDGAMLSNQWVGNYWVDGSGAWTKTKQPAQWILSGNRWWYRHSDGGYTTNNFETIGDKKYYFDNAGWMVTGWQKAGNNWYYFDGSGAMVSSQWIGNYYVDANGVMATNQWIGNYYVGDDGVWVKDKKPEHTHNWVAETKTINHPEESHQELVKAAWVEEINYPEEGHYETTVDGYWEYIYHEAEGDKKAYTERNFVDGYTKETDANGLDVEIPVFENVAKNICNQCGEDITGNEYNHDDNHLLNGGTGGWHTEYRMLQTGTETKHYDAVWVVDKEAYTETINHDAEYKKVVDKEAWTETKTIYKCSCGATK